jgi:hypothetical protein
MAITLTHNSTTAHLSERLLWTDEYRWSPVEQVVDTGTTGKPLIHVGLRQGGRPITLEGTESNAWITRALCETLQAWEALPGAVFALVLRGTTHQVIFDHAAGGFEAQPIWRLADGQQTPDQVYLPTFRFLTLGA